MRRNRESRGKQEKIKLGVTLPSLRLEYGFSCNLGYLPTFPALFLPTLAWVYVNLSSLLPSLSRSSTLQKTRKLLVFALVECAAWIAVNPSLGSGILPDAKVKLHCSVCLLTTFAAAVLCLRMLKAQVRFLSQSSYSILTYFPLTSENVERWEWDPLPQDRMCAMSVF